MNSKLKIATVLSTTYLFMGVFCSSVKAEPATQAPNQAANTTQAAPAALTDGQIIELVKTADEAEVDAAKIAKSKAQNQDVKEFAKHMIDEHKKHEKEDKATAKSVGVKREKSDAVAMLKDDAKAKAKTLKSTNKEQFDREYMSQQVAMHTQLINDIDSKLMPAAQNAETKTFLQSTRSAVQAHLDRAKEIQTALK